MNISMKKVFILFSVFCLASCDKDALIPVGTSNGATVEITGISSVGFNSAIVGLSVNYPAGRTLKSVGIQSNNFTTTQVVTNAPILNGSKQTLNVNVNLSNLSPNQNYLVKPFADISVGESNSISNLNIKFLGIEKLFQTQPFPLATGYLNFQLIKTNLGSVSPSNATEFDNLIKDKTVLNTGTILINPNSVNLINWFPFSELNSVLKSTLTGDYFALVVSGYFVPLETGIYTFTLQGDDSQEFSLDGKVVIGNYGPTAIYPTGTYTGTTNMIAGKTYELRVRMQETEGGEGLRFFWKKPSNQANWIQDANELRATLSGELPKGPVVNTVVSKTGRIWMDRNLGASQVATSPTDEKAFGDLYQWGRPADGHQLRISGTTTNLSSTDQPGNNNFIIVKNAPTDWRSTQNNNLWQGVNGINNPCPSGFRLPTESEWNLELLTWAKKNATGAFESVLKLPSAGSRIAFGGNILIDNNEPSGFYWSSTIYNLDVINFDFYNRFSGSNAYTYPSHKATGVSVRCIKD